MSEILWSPTPESIQKSELTLFQSWLSSRYPEARGDYHSLWTWSVENPELFWSGWAEYSGFLFQNPPRATWSRKEFFWETEWFPDSVCNFAENILKKIRAQREREYIHFSSEPGTSEPEDWTGVEILETVGRIRGFWRKSNLEKGDRVAAVLPNSPLSILGAIATTSLGGVWSSASPDFGTKGILDRFSQISPKVLVLSDGYYFKGKWVDCLEKWEEVLDKMPSLQTVFIWIFSDRSGSEILEKLPTLKSKNIILWTGKEKETGKDQESRFQDFFHTILEPDKNYPSEDPKNPDTWEFVSIRFSDPVYIMYSSGTTGLPKCIVQGPGVLLNHTKELRLHSNLREGERIAYYTTCGWMMWNWVFSSLALGAKLCIFDGNPFYPDWRTLWAWIDSQKINVFGTSAKYLTVMMEEGARANREFSLGSLKVLLSTGSPLPESAFRYVYSSIKSDIQLSSISGGTDLNGCFALGNPNLPVRSGELQCRGLGMDVAIWDEEGKEILANRGELVCKKPFPSMPLYFWGDSSGEKYRSAYFERFPNVWCHGDFAELRESGGMVIYGRSDATLNPGGVRIGTADIYSIVEGFSDKIQDSVIIGQDFNYDVRIILFVQMKPGENLTKELESEIKTRIKTEVSPRHIPGLILPVSQIPYTVNGKKVELAVKYAVEGKEIKNKNSLANPDCLDEYREVIQPYL
jgi:acetoacetyl-CoA synthetase